MKGMDEYEKEEVDQITDEWISCLFVVSICTQFDFFHTFFKVEEEGSSLAYCNRKTNPTLMNE